jgi:Flp pilus assembly pilin Flp
MKLRKLALRYYTHAHLWLSDRRGVMEERAVMAAILILAVLAALQALGASISDWFTQVANAY